MVKISIVVLALFVTACVNPGGSSSSGAGTQIKLNSLLDSKRYKSKIEQMPPGTYYWKVISEAEGLKIESSLNMFIVK